MTITRPSFLLFSPLAAAQTASSQQGVASRDVTPQTAPAPSQRPFPARLTDVAEEAGLEIDCSQILKTKPQVEGLIGKHSAIMMYDPNKRETVGSG